MTTRRIMAAAWALLLGAACATTAPPEAAPASQVASQPAQAAPQPLPLRMPIHGVMIGVIDFSSFGLFLSATTEGQLSEKEWNAAGLAALNLIGASTLITVPGTGQDDARWTADPVWRQSAADMQAASVATAVAVRTRNREALNVAANALADACQACHAKFRSDLPPVTRQAARLPATSGTSASAHSRL